MIANSVEFTVNWINLDVIWIAAGIAAFLAAGAAVLIFFLLRKTRRR